MKRIYIYIYMNVIRMGYSARPLGRLCDRGPLRAQGQESSGANKGTLHQ
jgi:hypothetical protein